jgi:hypothetical protein
MTNNMKRIITVFFSGIMLFLSCSHNPEISPTDERIRFFGRVEYLADSAVVMYWPGSSVLTRFRGTEIRALLKDVSGKNYYNVILDDSVIRVFHPDTVKKWCLLANSLKDTIHTLELFRRVDRGPTWFFGFKTDPSGTFLPLSPPPERKMEFYGNSITVGASVHDHSGNDYYDSTYTDNYAAYGALTARHYQTGYSCIARGGIGLMASWYPLIMPEMWNRLNPDDPESRWDFSKYTPHIVVINLFQNDAALFERPDHPQMQSHFGGKVPDEEQVVEAYKDFLKKIRKVYPDANIICTLGSMNAVREDRPWRGYVEKAVEEMKDPRIFNYFFFYKGGYLHPQEAEQRRMADSLIRFIDHHIKW